MRHEEEEKRAKHMLREEEGTGRKGRLGIDLDSGVVVIGADRSGTEAPLAGDHARRDSDSRPDDHGAEPSAGDAGTGNDAGRNGSARSADRSKSRSAKPGEPQIARRSPGAAPEGKARRRGGSDSGSGVASSPVGKARRIQK